LLKRLAGRHLQRSLSDALPFKDSFLPSVGKADE